MEKCTYYKNYIIWPVIYSDIGLRYIVRSDSGLQKRGDEYLCSEPYKTLREAQIAIDVINYMRKINEK